MEYLIKTGSERVSQQCKENMYAVQTLKDFQYVDRDGKDQGVNVREKAKQLVALLRDEDRLREERAHALKTKEKLAQTATGEVSLPLLEVPGSEALSSVPVGPRQLADAPFPPLVWWPQSLRNFVQLACNSAECILWTQVCPGPEGSQQRP